MNTVITIGRQFGSGGRDIGEKLAVHYGIAFYDKDLFENNDEKPTSSFLYNLVTDTYSFGYSSPYIEMPLSHKVFLAQFDTIKKIAQEGPCVIVGRCADYALSDFKDRISIFIYAPLEDRIRRITEKYPDVNDPSKIKDMIVKTDKSRANYYNYYSSKKWGRADSYDLCVNSSILGIDGTVDLISDFIDKIS